ncbi:hypothetical protein [Halovivax gelatinilyticus]|uniref:hypothetical protein n=1 Tax=Halovivax gelatinilyticus TaxID=2961597 RepID=UPI0020CA5909|nr:hypothetical protein [Halovivax gelatinilyticus]
MADVFRSDNSWPKWKQFQLTYVVIGTAHAIAVLWVHSYIRGGQFVREMVDALTSSSAMLVVYLVIGLGIVGYALALTVIRHHLVLPASVTTLAYGYASYTSWQSFSAAREASVQPLLTWRTDDIYVFAWFIPLAGILLLSYVELRVRELLAE